MMNKKNKKGFTLLELMVAVGLMSFIMVIIVDIFKQSTSSYNIGIDQLTIYSSSRALDMMVMDLSGCFALETGQQKFILEDKDDDLTIAKDGITFSGIALVMTQTRSAQISYFLAADKDYSILNKEGKPGVEETTKTARKLYALRRQTAELDGSSVKSADLWPCVLSLNIEVFDSASKSFKQIREAGYTFPIKDTTQKMPIGLRFTLRLVANAAERQERIITRVIWIPMGG